MSTSQEKDLSPDARRLLDDSLNSVREALLGLKFGNISLTVHEGRVTQIDITEKKRLKAG